MKLKNSDIQEAAVKILQKEKGTPFPSEIDCFKLGAIWAAGEAQHVIDRCNQNNAENVSFAVGEAEKEQDEKYMDKLLFLAADYHKSGQHTAGHVVEYVIDYLL